MQTDTPVCVCTYAYLHQQILVLPCILGLGGWEGWINQRKGDYCPRSGGALIPLAFHISTSQSPEQALLSPVRMGREEMEIICMSACPILPFVEFLGQQKCSNGPDPHHPPGAFALLNLDITQDFSSRLVKVRTWPRLNRAVISQRFIRVLLSELLSSLRQPARPSRKHMRKFLQNWVPDTQSTAPREPPPPSLK